MRSHISLPLLPYKQENGGGWGSQSFKCIQVSMEQSKMLDSSNPVYNERDLPVANADTGKPMDEQMVGLRQCPGFLQPECTCRRPAVSPNPCRAMEVLKGSVN